MTAGLVTAGVAARSSARPGSVGPAPGSVRRARVVDRLVEGAATPIVVVDAPPGYGKTTAVAQWVTAEPRPVAWLTLADAHNRPAVLLRDLASALEVAGLRPFDAEPAADDQAAMHAGLPWFASTLERRSEPFVLVLDEADHLRHGNAHTFLRVVTRHLPPGSQVVLVARNARDLSVGTLAARRNLLRLGIGDLAMDAAEAAELLHGAGVELDAEALGELTRRTEGWPVALALAAGPLASAPDAVTAARDFDGATAPFAEYLAQVVLPRFTTDELALLRAGSILDLLSGAACDVLLGSTGSGEVLVELARTTALVARVDRTGTCYRIHNLLRDGLSATLPSEGSAARRKLHARASRACERQDDVHGAIVNAWRAAERERAADLLWCAMPGSLGTSRAVDFASLLGLWSEDETADNPALCCSAAWNALVAGNPSDVPKWVEFARRAPEDLVLADGTPLRSTLALLRSVVSAEGLTRTLADATLAVELDRRDDPMLTIAYSVQGAAHRLLGQRDEARALLEEAADLASVLTPTIRAQCLTHLALLAADDERMNEAEALIGTAYAIAVEERATERPTMTLLHATRAALAARHGDVIDSVSDAENALELVSRLDAVMPWLAIEARILVARAFALVGSSRPARMVLNEAEHLLGKYPDSGTLPDRLREAREVVERVKVPLGLTASRLTPAELRVLKLLPTHLSFPEIADALFVSRHTVKTHAVAVYHKLGVSSRRAAVARATELGLLE